MLKFYKRPSALLEGRFKYRKGFYMKDKLFKKQDIIIIALIFAAAAAAMLFFRPAGKGGEYVAKVTVNNKEIMTIELYKHTGDEFIDLSEIAGVPVTLQVTDSKIRFVNSKCPDHICEGYGYISEEYQSAVCMPFKTAVTIYPK